MFSCKVNVFLMSKDSLAPKFSALICLMQAFLDRDFAVSKVRGSKLPLT